MGTSSTGSLEDVFLGSGEPGAGAIDMKCLGG